MRRCRDPQMMRISSISGISAGRFVKPSERQAADFRYFWRHSVELD